jgi:NADPH:quinone reductase-like Zn-dependent oxidoreductase
MALAGRVEAVGAKVTTVRPGDEVYGDAPAGAFAEYAIVPAQRLAPKPANLSFEEAAATSWAVTPLQGLRDVGGLQAGQKVLINGASGGVGTWAIQLAKALGAEVTAVCSGRNAEMVRALGADAVIDYTKEDFVGGGARFDLVFDTVGNRALSDFRKVLNLTGTYVACGGEANRCVRRELASQHIFASPSIDQESQVAREGCLLQPALLPSADLANLRCGKNPLSEPRSTNVLGGDVLGIFSRIGRISMPFGWLSVPDKLCQKEATISVNR